MSANSKIEWCDHTFNPWIGCTKVSPGCANCYAEGVAHRFSLAEWGKGKPRRMAHEDYWKQPLAWDRKAQRAGVRHRVFCASLSDWLDDEVRIEWLAMLLSLIHATPNLDWLLLTKRPEHFDSRLDFILRMFSKATSKMFGVEITYGFHKWLIRWVVGKDAPHNVWVGVSVEDQIRADERISQLLDIPAKVRFLSCEPLLGPVILCKGCPGCPNDCGWTPGTNGYGIHWVIIGGESGPKSRPCNVEWIRSIKSQCKLAGVPVFVKQLGAHPRIDKSEESQVHGHLLLKNRKGGDMSEWPADLRVREFPR